MRDRLVHRGPDSLGASSWRVAGARASAFRRLRIIDLSAEREPADVERGRHGPGRLQRRDLQLPRAARAGSWRAATASDRERHRSDRPPLRGEGRRPASRDLDGMFAIAIWDERGRRLMLARDRAGKKPLFYYRDERRAGVRVGDQGVLRPSRHAGIEIESRSGAVLFHPRLRAASRRRSTSACARSSPATVMTVDADGRLAERGYWRLEFPDGDRRPRRSSRAEARRTASAQLVTRAVDEAAGQRRAARGVSQRRHRLHDRRRAHEPADDASR